jgi:Tfp pilus assembly protein PilF
VEVFLQAVELMGAQRYGEAQQILTTGIKNDPSNLDLYEALARLYDRTDQNDLGVEICRSWSMQDPQSNMALSNLSVFYQKLNRIEEAELAKAQATTLFMKQSMAEAKRANNG